MPNGSATTQPCAESPSPEDGESCGMKPLAACQDFRKAQQSRSSRETLFAFSDDQAGSRQAVSMEASPAAGVQGSLPRFGIIQKQRKAKAPDTPDIKHSSFCGPLVMLGRRGGGGNSPNALTAWRMKILHIDLYGLVKSVKTTTMTALLLK